MEKIKSEGKTGADLLRVLGPAAQEELDLNGRLRLIWPFIEGETFVNKRRYFTAVIDENGSVRGSGFHETN